MKVFVLQHESAAEDVKLIGVYGTAENAADAKERASRLPGFRDDPDGFTIDSYDLDRDGWREGYVTVEAGSPALPDRAA